MDSLLLTTNQQFVQLSWFLPNILSLPQGPTQDATLGQPPAPPACEKRGSARCFKVCRLRKQMGLGPAGGTVAEKPVKASLNICGVAGRAEIGGPRCQLSPLVTCRLPRPPHALCLTLPSPCPQRTGPICKPMGSSFINLKTFLVYLFSSTNEV